MQPTASQTDPGKTLGIVGFIMAFVGLQVVGLILSIVGYDKSKKAGHKNGLAFAGIILNGIATLLVVILLPIITIVAYNGITIKAKTSTGLSAAHEVVLAAESYDADNGGYPGNLSQLKGESTFIDSTVKQSSAVITSPPSVSSTIEFYTCGLSGNKIGYWDYANNNVIYVYSGVANDSSTCNFVAN